MNTRSSRRRRRRRANADEDAYYRPTNNESAANFEEESSDEHAADDLTSLLFKAIKPKCENGTDDWVLVPFQDMQDERNISEYGNYVNSDCVLSKWIGVDGNLFQQCLFEEKSRKTSRAAYLKEEFGLHAVTVRGKLTLIYFGKRNPNPTFGSYNLLLGQPSFSAGPVKAAKNALARQDCELTKEIVHNFIRDLKESSRDARALQICEAMMDLDQETIKSIATHVTSLTNEVAVGTSSTSTAYL